MWRGGDRVWVATMPAHEHLITHRAQVIIGQRGRQRASLNHLDIQRQSIGWKSSRGSFRDRGRRCFGGRTHMRTLTNPSAIPTEKINIFVLEQLTKGGDIQTFKCNFSARDQRRREINLNDNSRIMTLHEKLCTLI